jgi:hypothetical protein
MIIKDAKPQVGIFEIVENVFLKDTEDTQMVSDTGRYFDGYDAHFHKDVIKLLVRNNSQISDKTKQQFLNNRDEYLKWPRGRIDYDTIDKTWTIMSSRDVLMNSDLVERITREFNLPPLNSGKIELVADEGHYGLY